LNREVTRQKLYHLPLAAQPSAARQPEKNLEQADALISIILLSTHKKILGNISRPRGLFFLIPCDTIINNK
jgi:hypothetical protein